MSEAKTPAGQIRSEVHGRVFKIIIDNAAKKNAFSPEMMAHMSDALTTSEQRQLLRLIAKLPQAAIRAAATPPIHGVRRHRPDRPAATEGSRP